MRKFTEAPKTLINHKKRLKKCHSIFFISNSEISIGSSEKG